LIRAVGWNVWFAWAAAVAVTMVFAACLEALVLRHLYRRTELSQVLFTIGLSFFLIAGTNALAGPQIQLILLPEWLTGSMDLGFRTLPAQRALVFVVV
jgi:branched-chain amino acid transport system permease protein